MKFVFDPAKSARNKIKHGLDFIEAQALWDDENLLVFPLHVEEELRYACIGMFEAKHWTAIMTCRYCMVRLISVRRARKDEVRAYENEGI